MKPRSSIMARWTWNDVAPTEIATADSATKVGRSTAALFVAAVVVGLASLVAFVGLPEEGTGIELKRLDERFEMVDGTCMWNIIATLENHEESDFVVERFQTSLQFDSYVGVTGEGGTIPAGETVDMTTSHPLGAECPGSIRSLDHGDLTMVWNEPPDGEPRFRSFQL